MKDTPRRNESDTFRLQGQVHEDTNQGDLRKHKKKKTTAYPRKAGGKYDEALATTAGFLAHSAGGCVPVCRYLLRFPPARYMSSVTWKTLVTCAMSSPRYTRTLTRANDYLDREKSSMNQNALQPGEIFVVVYSTRYVLSILARVILPWIQVRLFCP